MDEERIDSIIRSIESYEDTLKALNIKNLKEYKEADIKTKSTAERHLQLISDLEQDILLLLYKSLFKLSPVDIKDVIHKLSGTFEDNVIESIKKRKRLRNRLVHAYMEGMYDEEVFEQLKDLSDVDGFLSAAKKIKK